MTEPTNRVIIERIEPRSWALRVRDTKTDQVHELELRGGGPWKIDLNGKAVVSDEGRKQRPQVAVPPDDAITLRIERSDRPGVVRVAAVGRGAKAWVDVQGTLLGSRWSLDAMGAPAVLLEDRPNLVEAIQAALPEVTIDASKYVAEPDAPGVTVPAANTAPSVGLKKSRRGFGGKVKVPPDTDIELGLSNVGRTDDMVRVVAKGGADSIDAAELAAWVEQRAASLGPWQASDPGKVTLVRDHQRLPEQLAELFPGIRLDLSMYRRAAARDAATAPAKDVGATDPDAKAVDATTAGQPASKSRGRKKAKPEPGPGPGGLAWESIDDRGSEGLAARWGEGQFKLLHIGGDKYGLFYEHDGGGYETLLCGTLDDGKKAAAERASTRPSLDLGAAQLACAATRKTGRPTNDEITLHLRHSEDAGAAIIVRAAGDRVHEWVFAHQTALGREWVRREDNIPEVTVHDSPTLVADLRKEFPGVNIDTSDYKKSRRASKAETPAAEPAEARKAAPVETGKPAEPETPAEAPSVAPPPGDEASQDAELLRHLKGQLADMLDEED